MGIINSSFRFSVFSFGYMIEKAVSGQLAAFSLKTEIGFWAQVAKQSLAGVSGSQGELGNWVNRVESLCTVNGLQLAIGVII
jgi:hypothetical protein